MIGKSSTDSGGRQCIVHFESVENIKEYFGCQTKIGFNKLEEVDRKRFTYASTKGRLEYKPLNILDTLNVIRYGTHKRNYQSFKNVIRLEKRKLIIAKTPSSKPVFYTPQTLEIRIKKSIRSVRYRGNTNAVSLGREKKCYLTMGFRLWHRLLIHGSKCISIELYEQLCQ